MGKTTGDKENESRGFEDVALTPQLGDESALHRFLREARAAASVRHPNVASVFHLGGTGSGYFYATEFVEGETLENLIKRSGRLEVKPSTPGYVG
jgi:serine/threonine protein kinase